MISHKGQTQRELRTAGSWVQNPVYFVELRIVNPSDLQSDHDDAYGPLCLRS